MEPGSLVNHGIADGLQCEINPSAIADGFPLSLKILQRPWWVEYQRLRASLNHVGPFHKHFGVRSTDPWSHLIIFQLTNGLKGTIQ